MLLVDNVSLRLGKRVLFEEVNVKFTDGNCYGVIGANGAGKSTFLKILSKELEPTTGNVVLPKDKRLSFLKQDHFEYDDKKVIDVVIMGNKVLYEIMKEKDEIYAKENFTDEDGIKVGELETLFAEMNGWDSETDAAILLNGLGIDPSIHYELMKNIDDKQKVKVLLAQSLFGEPDVLLLDEPTNHLDIESINWLEEFLINFKNTVIVVSHDRYFLNKVCTHTLDIDFDGINLYTGNYDFWYESSQLMQRQMKDGNKKKEEQIKELQDFVSRFSANASKSRQATSRKKLLDKIQLTDIKPSNRKYPFIEFKSDREVGNEVLIVDSISKTIDGEKVLDNVSFIVGKKDKIAFIGSNDSAKTVLFDILAGKIEPDSGTVKYGITVSKSYFENDHNYEFERSESILDWLMGYSKIKEIPYVRGFLGRMLFSGDDCFKKINVLSGGEKVRCLLSKMMLSGANLFILDNPTNHLDMEAITALNNGLIKTQSVILFSSHDHQIIQTSSNRLIKINIDGKINDYPMTYDEYLETKSE